MNGKMFPPLVGDKVTVRIPEGFPELMMIVVREILRNPPETEQEAYGFIADLLERMIEEERHGKDDLTAMVEKLNKTDEERLIDKLKDSGYTDEQLDTFASTIQRGWKHYAGRTTLRSNATKDILSTKNKAWTHEMITDELMKFLDNNGITLNTANATATLIQRAWRKYRILKSSLQTSSTSIIIPSKTDLLDEIHYENDSDSHMELVNVIKKGQIGYVPPIPDYIDDLDTLIDESMSTNLPKNISFEDVDEPL